MLGKYDFDIRFDVSDDEMEMYTDELARFAERIGQLESEVDLTYDITVEGGDLDDLLRDGVAEIQLVGGDYDQEDNMGNYFVEHNGAHIPLENCELASFDVDDAISNGTFSQVSGMSDVYRMVDGSDELYAANIGDGAISFSGRGLEDVEMSEPGEYQYKVRLLDDGENVVDESDWHSYDVGEASLYEEMNDRLPGETQGVKSAAKEVGSKYARMAWNVLGP